MKKLILIAIAVVLCAIDAFPQIVYGSGTNNTQFHHFTRDGAGSVVYINQLSSAANHPILRLSSGIANANQNVKFTVENNGYVGIGTTTPTSKLTIFGSTTLASRFNPDNAYLQLTDGTITMLFDGNEITTNESLLLNSSFDHPIRFRNVSDVTSEELMRITPDGKLGIGTTDPAVKLEVKGSNAQWIYVNQGTRGGLRIGSSDEDRVNVLYRDKSNDRVTLRAGHDHGELAFLAGGTDSERMRITQNGNIGIGTNSPNSKLSIYQSGTIGKVFDASNAYLELTDGTISMLLDGNEIHSNQNLILGSAYSNDITFNNIDANGSDQLMVIKGNGRVGIGTNSPSTGFELKGSGSEWVYVNHSNIGGLRIASSDAGMLNVLYRDRSNDQVTLRAGHDHGAINFIAGGANTERMRINPDGGVGIGTQTTGTHKLAVEGSIGAREVTIEATVWPDYVFEEDYDLKSLEEVSAFVNENGHLPEVPSAQQVEKEGVDLGSMSEVLLQKIEELTLYMIDQNEQLKAQIEENKSQQSTIEALQKELSELKASIEE